jgi:hypothetical protein
LVVEWFAAVSQNALAQKLENSSVITSVGKRWLKQVAMP